MMSFIGGLFDKLPPLAKEILLLVLGILFLLGAFRGGSLRERLFSVAK